MPLSSALPLYYSSVLNLVLNLVPWYRAVGMRHAGWCVTHTYLSMLFHSEKKRNSAHSTHHGSSRIRNSISMVFGRTASPSQQGKKIISFRSRPRAIPPIYNNGYTTQYDKPMLVVNKLALMEVETTTLAVHTSIKLLVRIVLRYRMAVTSLRD